MLLLVLCFICTTVQSQIVKEEKDGFKWIPYLEYGRIGAKSVDGKIIVPAKYITCYYERGHFSVKNNTGNYGVFGKDGKVIVPTENVYAIYEIAEMKSNSPFVVVGDGGYGVYTSNGDELIPQKYKHITPYKTSKGLYYVVIAYNGLSGLIDSRGKTIIPPNKYNALILSDLNDEVYISYLKYGANRSSGICDFSGNIVLDTKYTYVIPVLDSSNNLYYKVAIGNSVGKMAQDGTIIKAPVAKKSFNYTKFGSDFIYTVIDENSYYGVANKNKQIVIPCEYDFVEVEYPYITVKKGRYMGLFNKNFTPIISPEDKYIDAVYMDGDNPYISVSDENNCNGLFDVNGKKLSEPLYSAIFYHVFTNTNDTVLVYKQKGLYGVKKIDNKTIFRPRYQDLSFMETPIGNFYLVFKNNLVGLCNSDGIEIIEPQFSGIFFKRQKGKDYFYAENDGYAAVFNPDGTQLINGETFSKITYDETNLQFIATHGKRKCCFTKDGILLRDNLLNIEQDKYISLADSYFEEEKYRLAAKNYGLALDISPTPSLYFNRGVSYYNLGKYKDAISDFKLCLENKPSKNLRIRSLELIDRAEEYQFQKEQRQASIASAIFGLVLTGANMYFEAQRQKQYNRYNSSYSGRNSQLSSSSNKISNDVDDEIQSSGSTNNTCPSLKVNHGKWYCANTGECGMCGGDGLMDNPYGLPDDKCTLCGGSGKCKYCQ